MAAITTIAEQFFHACETGKGWDVCKQFCTPDATFAAQAEPLEGIKTVETYCGWMIGLLQIMPNGRYDMVSFATDEQRSYVSGFAVFHGTHTGPGGPVPATGKSIASDYVYVMKFDGNKISHVTKIWHAGLAMKELGWT
jgi:SnoaL-like polyketide cyclase